LQQSILINIATCYLHGRYVDKNYEKAKEYFILAINLGSEQATHMLASMFKLDNFDEQRLGFQQLETEYKTGSAYSAGKLGDVLEQFIAVSLRID